MNTTILADKFGLSIAPIDAPGGGTQLRQRRRHHDCKQRAGLHNITRFSRSRITSPRSTTSPIPMPST